MIKVSEYNQTELNNSGKWRKLLATKDVWFGKYWKCSQMSLIKNSSYLLLTYFMKLAIKNADIIPNYMDKNA
jgi:hypothetical protein